MVKNLNENYALTYSIITAVLATFIVVGIVSAWTEPSVIPPGGNVSAPINAGDNNQIKLGNLGLNANGNYQYGLIIYHGDVGIGVSGPSYKLDVDGEIHATGDICTDAGGGVCLSTAGGSGNVTGSGTTNRIPVWVGATVVGNSPFSIDTSNEWIDFANYKLKGVKEIDPVFNILGKKYTSYVPDIIHQKIEVVGQDALDGDELVINFELEEEGSDLWLFWQTVTRETIIPFVSSQSDAGIYAYVDDSKFIIKLKEGEQNAKFSYRLIGTRLDHADDTDNLYDDQSVEYFIDIDSLRK